MRPEIEIPIVLSVAFVAVIAFILLKIKRDKVEAKKILNNLTTKKESVVNKDLEGFFKKDVKIITICFPQGFQFEIQRIYESKNKTLFMVSPADVVGINKIYYKVYLVLCEDSPEELSKKCNDILKTLNYNEF